MAKNIAVLGNGYVGLLAAVGLADFGNTCIGVDVNSQKIERLNAGISPIYEPGVEVYLRRNLDSGRLRFTTDAGEAIRRSQVLFITVGTPSKEDGSADLSFLEQVVQQIIDHLDDYKVIVTKSTVPVGTNRWILNTIASVGFIPGKDFDVVSNPEFLREGRATRDFFHPERTVIGCESKRAKAVMKDVYWALNLISVPFLWCSLETAELIKYASNAFLAVKISYMNEIANLSESVGADVHQVALAMGMDSRISPKFLHSGPGYGGSCFPKDTAALVHLGHKHKVPMQIVNSAIVVNDAQKNRMVDKLASLMGKEEYGVSPAENPFKNKVIAVLGLAFKSETDDIRESPSLIIIDRLCASGAVVKANDPKAMENFSTVFPDIQYCSSVYDALTGADAVILVTDWNEYRSLDLDKAAAVMKGRIFLDTRNVLNPHEAEEKGFIYEGVGRGKNPSQIAG